MIDAVLRALGMAFAMGWEILWPLILGFALSAVVQAVVSHREMARLLPDDRPRSIATALALGAASSSCSYAAVALARSLFRKGANFTAAMAFEMASTNLVLELSIIMLAFLGWQLTLAEFVGAPIMVGLLILLFRWFLNRELLEQAKAQADKGVSGRMEGHAEMDMSVTEGTLWQRLTSERGLNRDQPLFRDGLGRGLARHRGRPAHRRCARRLGPPNSWQSFFLVDHPLLAKLWGPIVGPLVAVISFVCSVGNIPLAAVLWNGGISFGGVIAFIFADLIVLPILNIYRKYYGLKMAGFLFATLLRRDGGCRADCRADIRGSWSHPRPTQRASRGITVLHGTHTTLAQHRLSRSRGLFGLAIPENWRSRNVAHDEQTGCNGALSLEPSVRNCMDVSWERRFTVS